MTGENRLLDWDGALWRVCHHHRVRWPVAGHCYNGREWEDYYRHLSAAPVPVEATYAEVEPPQQRRDGWDEVDPGDDCPFCTWDAAQLAFTRIMEAAS